MRRFGAMFVFAFLFFGFVVAAFITILVNIFSSATSGGGFVAFIPLAIVVLLLFGTATRGFRRFAAPLGDLIDAREKVEAVRLRRPRARAWTAAASFSRDGLQLDVRLSEQRARASTLLADVTHELRTPLTIMQGNLEALLDGVYPAVPSMCSRSSRRRACYRSSSMTSARCRSPRPARSRSIASRRTSRSC